MENATIIASNTIYMTTGEYILGDNNNDKNTNPRVDQKTKNGIFPAYGFMRASKLKHIVLPTEIDSIGGSSLRLCTALESVDMSKCKAKGMGANTFRESKKITTFHISPYLRNFIYDAFVLTAANTSFTVDPDNQWFAAYDNALYSKDYTELYAFPMGLTGAYTLR